MIDRMLTDKYKSLHPRSKPSIVRMDKETGSANNLLNTLQNSVLGAASQRALGYNQSAIESDEKKLNAKLITAIEKILEQHDCYEEVIRKTIAFDHVESEMANDASIAGITAAIVAPNQDMDFKTITDFIASGFLQKLTYTSLDPRERPSP